MRKPNKQEQNKHKILSVFNTNQSFQLYILIFIDILAKIPLSRVFYILICAMPLPLVAIKIVNEQKVVCAQNLTSIQTIKILQKTEGTD